MRHRPDLLTGESPEGLEVYQLTDNDVKSAHIYMEVQMFSPDSRRFIMYRMLENAGGKLPLREFLLCDCESGELLPVADEPGATAPRVSPDGRYLYYHIRPMEKSKGRNGPLILRRRNLDGTEPTDIMTFDGFVPGTPYPASGVGGITISSDSKRLAFSLFLGDGLHEGAPFGLCVVNLETGGTFLPLAGPRWRNMHEQYCRSTDPDAMHDLLVQENHGAVADADGKHLRTVGGDVRGIDIHVIRDDGQSLRSLPWGRTPEERCQGHQCWRGNTRWAITSTHSYAADGRHVAHLIESLPLPYEDDLGKELGGVRNRLCRSGEERYYSHFATDMSGRFLISDCMDNIDEFDRSGGKVTPYDGLYLMRLNEPGAGAASVPRLLLRPRCSWRDGMHHIHPFLSPDGKMAFFNSDEAGVLHAYMIKNISV